MMAAPSEAIAPLTPRMSVPPPLVAATGTTSNKTEPGYSRGGAADHMNTRRYKAAAVISESSSSFTSSCEAPRAAASSSSSMSSSSGGESPCRVDEGAAEERCAECGMEFTDMQTYWSHECTRTQQQDDAMDDDDDGGVMTDVESFDGKIVYNPDGSAYIIEGESELSEAEQLLPRHEGRIVDQRGAPVTSPSVPHIASAFYVQRNPNPYYNNFYVQQYPSDEGGRRAEAPIMHSYRVYDLRSSQSKEDDEGAASKLLASHPELTEALSVPTKPILMCFICKLSFGYAKSFVAHASGEHRMSLTSAERELMNKKNASAIIQGVGRGKEPLMSFLEPTLPAAQDRTRPPSEDQRYQPYTGTAHTNVSFVYSNSKVSAMEQSSGNESSEESEDEAGVQDGLPVPHPSTSPPPVGLPASTSQDSMVVSPTSLKHGIVIRGGCDEHPQGNITGVDCLKCDVDVSAASSSSKSSSLGGHMTMMHSRNSCKTLKCPKCNWHYKYQETLEIHMKEKHPENETSCVYCLTNQSHPRLSRGEVYTCGYKPYRCEVCNYSTTTKGNLSIHMQSDKHINNMQELQNGAPPPDLKLPPSAQPPPASPVHAPTTSTSAADVKKATRPKPTWRCDVCNYETNVARNLRIHMTSEKHSHNMMVLQQNVKHMQREFQMNQMAILDPAALALMPPGAPGSQPPPPPPGLPPFGFDQTMFMTPLPSNVDSNPMDLSRVDDENKATSSSSSAPVDVKNNNNESGSGGASCRLFQCFVCNAYSTDSLEALHQHMQLDRARTSSEADSVSVVGGTFLCHLCSYKTNLKANFQLHCKTDKHLQKLQLVNHIREGGAANEWRLKYMNVSNPVQVRCNACDHYTNSIHKLQMHTASPRHEANAKLFQYLQEAEARLGGPEARGGPTKPRYYQCELCSFATKSRLNLIQHVRSMKHMRNESLRSMRRPENDDDEDDLAMFTVKEYSDNDAVKFDETDGESEGLPVVGQDAPSSDVGKEQPAPGDAMVAHVTGQMTGQGSVVVACPLCQEQTPDHASLEHHLVKVHNVKSDNLQRLLGLVEVAPGNQASPTNDPDAVGRSAETLGRASEPSGLSAERPTGNPARTSPEKTESSESELNEAEELEARALKMAEEASMEGVILSDNDDNLRCQTCLKHFANIDALYSHQNELGHLELKQTPRGPGYLCWKKGCNQYFRTASALQTHFREIHANAQHVSVSERHVYKFRCNQCSLAFKTLDKVQLHSYYHLIRAATVCCVCGKNSRSITSMQKHVESCHMDSMTPAQMEQFTNSVASMAPIGQLAKKKSKGKEEEEEDDEGEEKAEEGGYNKEQFMEDYINSQAIAENSYSDPNRKYKCHRCKVAFTKQNYLSAHNKTLMHRKGYKFSYSMEKYLDPNRPYKCDVCKESFTQKNILLVHYNSVSHLHKLKQSGGLAATEAEVTVSSPSVSSPPSTTSAPSSQPTPPPPATLPEPDKKPYKCNICKVSYTQSSTLDIHIRSVLHQTRAGKIQELALNGQIDLSQPLIEQPTSEASRLSGKELQQKKLYTDLMQQQKNGSPASADPPIPPPLLFGAMQPMPPLLSLQSAAAGAAQATTSTHSRSREEQAPSTSDSVSQEPASSSPAASNLPQSTDKSAAGTESSTFGCQKCGSSFDSQETLVNHLQNECYMQAGPGALRGMPRFRPVAQRNLLENIGFECVMQFNESHQRRKRDDKNNNENNAESEKIPCDGPKIKEEISDEAKEVKEEVQKKSDMPEMNKCPCKVCGKLFSSIWVLKAHEEDVHKQLVPIEMVEEFSGAYKEDYEKRQQPGKQADSAEKVSTAEVGVRADSPSSVSSTPLPTPDLKSPRMTSLQSDIAASQALMHMPMFMPLNVPMPPMLPNMLPMMPVPPELYGMSMLDPYVLMPPHQQAAALAQQGKRARTRINDDQLKILRAHFDINNSPNDDQIQDMSERSGLPPKVIKHWFRNTLFKERQRNKDSPYNFNIPPATELNLEEYEKTGRVSAASTPSDRPESSKDADHGSVLPLRIDSVHFKEEDNQDKESVTSMSDSLVSSSPSTPVPIPPTMHLPSALPPAMSYSELSAALSNLSQSPAASSASLLPHAGGSVPRTSTPCNSAAHMAGKRANRTRFTDFQIKTLQEYFERNAYPKDDDLESLSKVLNLSPRVIVVWFQNARQKARKNYENHPPVDISGDEASRFNRTPGLNYQCKKCFTVFQRYYELIKHQRTHCYKDDEKFMGSASEHGNYQSPEESSNSGENLAGSEVDVKPSGGQYQCEQCNLSFAHLDKWKDHQSTHATDPALFSPQSAFGMLQNIAQQQQDQMNKPDPNKALETVKTEVDMFYEDDFQSQKRRYYDEDDDDRDDQPRDKRMRTTILPEQLDYLYQKYQLDCNPSRKQLESIAAEVGLKKRVVQVWFQNTRARERKGQYRAHQQIIHKRCPFCRALFRAKSALESHLATKHAEEMAKGEVKIEDIPDEDEPSTPSTPPPMPPALDMAKLLNNPYNVPNPFMPMPSPSFPQTTSDPVHSNMKRIYEDNLKKYINELSHASHQPPAFHDKLSTSPSSSAFKSNDNEAPLDLSKPLPTDKNNVDLDQSLRSNMDDSISENHSDSSNEDRSLNSNPSSPNGHRRGLQAKRFRTQMSSVQIRVMKSVFNDYKTPTMSECEMLGREIGLPKRVVQVWFQNARAKEKKHKLSMSGGLAELDFPRVPEKCTLCDFKYSHKYTIQDHVFTKRHVDRVRASLRDRDDQKSLDGKPGWTSDLSRQKSHLSDSSRSSSKDADKSRVRVKSESSDLSSCDPSKAVVPPAMTAGSSPVMNAASSQMINPFGLNLPPLLPAAAADLAGSMLPFMYPAAGLGAFFPGAGGLGMFPPALMPGPDSVRMYDVNTFCTPLALLQIPKSAIADIEQSVREGRTQLTHYTQDCSSLAQLKALLAPSEAGLLQQATLDVGYICSKCHLVFPGQEACVEHQAGSCYPGLAPADLTRHMVKLEQRQYECVACGVRCSTVQEYTAHCTEDRHRRKAEEHRNHSPPASTTTTCPVSTGPVSTGSQ